MPRGLGRLEIEQSPAVSHHVGPHAGPLALRLLRRALHGRIGLYNRSWMIRAASTIGSTTSSYEILAKLATGGMAEIYLARSASVAGVARYVVLKRVLRERASDFRFLRMFLDEARLAAQLQHPNIAQVYDVGKLGESYFFSMEYIHGSNVHALFKSARAAHRSLPISCALTIAVGAAAGLHHAHERLGVEGRPLQIVHRDVSPTNLMVSFEGNIKVVDFGVAKAADRVHATRTGAITGKIGYLSPEQALGRDLDRRSDVFSLGIVLWEMLTGARLYKRDSDFAAMAAIVKETPRRPSEFRAELPPELDAVVLRALAKRPEDRHQTAQELLEDLEATAAQMGALISVAGLSRFIRELLGPRPEPWLAFQASDARPEVVTVTCEPIPDDLPIDISNPLDRKLAAVVDLSREDVGDSSDASTTTPERPDVIDTRPMPIPDVTGSMPAMPPPAKPSRLRWWAPVIGGLALLAVTAMVVASSGGGDASRPPVQEQPASAPVLIDAALPEKPAAVAVAVVEQPPPDAGVPAEPPRPRRSSARPVDHAGLVVTACRAHEADKARKLLAKVPSAKRKRVLARCNAAGTTLEQRTGPDCDADPSRCQF